MKSLATLQGRLAKALVAVEKQANTAASRYHVVLYDVATGNVLPGWEPRSGSAGSIWLPDNKRDGYAIGKESV